MAEMWHPTKNNFEPTEITSRSGKRAWFKCSFKHEWQMGLENCSKSVKSGYRIGCPYCSNQRILAGFNDLATTAPKLATEWHPTKNEKLLPSQVMKGSGKIVWWQGQCGHEWKAQINSRSRNGCSQCGKSGVSKIEEAFIQTLNSSGKLFLDARSITLFEGKRPIKLDGEGYIEKTDSKVVFEYDGYRWHSSTDVWVRDIKKTKALLEAGYLVIRVREVSLAKKKLGFLSIENDKLFQIEHNYFANYLNLNDDAQKIIEWIEGK